MERVIALLEEKGTLEPRRPDLFIAALGKTAEELSFDWAASLRKAGLWVEMEYGSKGLKAQMKKAGRLGARKVLIAGDDELASGKGVLRDMETKGQVDVEIEDIVNRLKKIMRTGQ